MVFNEKELILKDGRLAALKTPETSDADKMLTYIRTACGETEFLMRYPEEWDSVTVQSEEQWIESGRSSQNQFSLSCYIDGEIAGHCSLTFGANIKTAHIATVAIAIIKKYWGLGIGSAFFTEMIAAAKARGTEIIELEYLEGNERAKKLYHKFGFSEVAVRPNAIRLKDGRHLSSVYMQKHLQNN